MKFDLSTLDSHEFEILAKDIMEKLVGTNFSRFKRGPDRGIDLSDNKRHPREIVQVKHYVESSSSQLISNLKKELKNVEKIKPEKYYIFCSKELGRVQKEELIVHFNGYIKNIDDIIDGTIIDDFLNDSKNIEILKRHYKLWLNSVEIISLLNNRASHIDSAVLINKITNNIKLFVNTREYYECLNILEKENILLITGNPGVGKTTITNILTYHYFKKDYEVINSDIGDIRDLKNRASTDPLKKELYILDDFLGQHYLDLKGDKLNDITSLINFLSENSNKKVIMNSRITILNEAKDLSIKFNDLYNQETIKKFTIDLNHTSEYDKARILSNHLEFYEIDDKEISSIREKQNYKRIISHVNYNPRIIEYCSKNILNKNDQETLYDYIMNNLANPDKIWEDEFRNRMSQYDVIFMYTLYSLTNDKVPINSLKRAFENRVKENNEVLIKNNFSSILNRLSKSLIKIEYKEGERYISVINPSVNDYLRKLLYENPNEIELLVINSVYINQVTRLIDLDFENRIKLFYITDVNQESLDYVPGYYYLLNIIKSGIKDSQIDNQVKLAFNNVLTTWNFKFKDILINLIRGEYIIFYNLRDLALNNLSKILSVMNMKELNEIYNWLTKKDIMTTEILSVFQQESQKVLITEVEEKLYKDLTFIANTVLIKTNKYMPFQNDELSENDIELQEEMKKKIYLELEVLIEEMKNELPYRIESTKDLINKLPIDNYGVTAIKMLYEEMENEAMAEYYEPDYEMYKIDQAIDEIFN